MKTSTRESFGYPCSILMFVFGFICTAVGTFYCFKEVLRVLGGASVSIGCLLTLGGISMCIWLRRSGTKQYVDDNSCPQCPQAAVPALPRGQCVTSKYIDQQHLQQELMMEQSQQLNHARSVETEGTMANNDEDVEQRVQHLVNHEQIRQQMTPEQIRQVINHEHIRQVNHEQTRQNDQNNRPPAVYSQMSEVYNPSMRSEEESIGIVTAQHQTSPRPPLPITRIPHPRTLPRGSSSPATYSEPLCRPLGTLPRGKSTPAFAPNPAYAHAGSAYTDTEQRRAAYAHQREQMHDLHHSSAPPLATVTISTSTNSSSAFSLHHPHGSSSVGGYIPVNPASPASSAPSSTVGTPQHVPAAPGRGAENRSLDGLGRGGGKKSLSSRLLQFERHRHHPSSSSSPAAASKPLILKPDTSLGSDDSVPPAYDAVSYYSSTNI